MQPRPGRLAPLAWAWRQRDPLQRSRPRQALLLLGEMQRNRELRLLDIKRREGSLQRQTGKPKPAKASSSSSLYLRAAATEIGGWRFEEAEFVVEATMEKPRQVVRKFLARPQYEGVGAVVRRSIGRFELRYFDPFLVLDEFSVAAPAGFPDHPHRGFETVTYMLEGAVTHEDFEGYRGTIKAGDVQWMTAGRGIVHSEMPAGPGTSKGLQLWVNLASSNKMIEPGYQEIQSKDIASTTADGVTVRVIAGNAMGARSPVRTRTPTMYLDFTVRPRAVARQPVCAAWNAFAYVLEGEGAFGSGGEKAGPHHLLLLGPGDGVEVWNHSDRPLRFLLVAGEPIGEPVAQLGPFVMNTEEEIDMTVNDFEGYVNGFEKARHWKSQAMVALGVE